MERKFLILAIFSILYCSISVMTSLGIMSLIPNAGTLQGLHIAFYPLVAAFIIDCLSRPIVLKKNMLCVMTIVAICLFNSLNGRDANWGPTMSSIIMPFMFAQVIGAEVSKDSTLCKRIKKIIIWFFVVNACLAICERTLSFHLFSTTSIIRDMRDFRSSTFFGHPLSAASAMSVIMCFISVSKLRPNTQIWLLVLGFLSLLCFNTRFAIVIMGMTMTIVVLRMYFVERISTSTKFGIFLFVCVSVIALTLMITETSLGGRLARMGLMDNEGSTQARLMIWDVFKKYSLEDFVFGFNYAKTQHILHSAKLYGIINENPLIIFLFRFGVFFTLIFILLYYRLFMGLLRKASNHVRFITIIPPLLILGAFNSIGEGDIALNVWVICFYAFLFPQTMKVKTNETDVLPPTYHQ